jgi:dimethylaniline monooxygenase (N-oxide forming)
MLIAAGSVHGEFRFSSLPMPAPKGWKESGGRITGEELRLYLESFSERFLKGKIRYDTVVTSVRRMRTEKREPNTNGTHWIVTIRDRNTGQEQLLKYDRVMLCTGASVPLEQPVHTYST